HAPLLLVADFGLDDGRGSILKLPRRLGVNQKQQLYIWCLVVPCSFHKKPACSNLPRRYQADGRLFERWCAKTLIDHVCVEKSEPYGMAQRTLCLTPRSKSLKPNTARRNSITQWDSIWCKKAQRSRSMFCVNNSTSIRGSIQTMVA